MQGVGEGSTCAAMSARRSVVRDLGVAARCPYGVGRFHRSSAEFLTTGSVGIAVSILHHEGDALWAMGSKADAPAAPPASLAAALAEAEAEEARRTEAQAAAKAAAEASAIAERIQEIPKLRRKAEKSLRQVMLHRQALVELKAGR